VADSAGSVLANARLAPEAFELGRANVDRTAIAARLARHVFTEPGFRRRKLAVRPLLVPGW